MRLLALGLALVAPACVTASIDLLATARRAADAGDLLRALAYLDHIAPAHPRYEEARALAKIVQRQVADSQRCIAAAMRARLLGDEGAATAELAKARRLWPKAVGLGEVQSIAALPVPPHGPEPAAPAPTPSPAVEVALGAPPPVGGEREGFADEPPEVPEPPVWLREPTPTIAEPRPPATAPESSGEPAPAAAAAERAAPLPSLPEVEGEPRRLDLLALRAAAQGRDANRAIVQLTAANRDHPDEPEVRALLAGLLRQRALVAYGRGWLEAAIEDWQHVTDLVPDDGSARAHLETAREELSRRLIREARKKNAGG